MNLAIQESIPAGLHREESHKHSSTNRKENATPSTSPSTPHSTQTQSSQCGTATPSASNTGDHVSESSQQSHEGEGSAEAEYGHPSMSVVDGSLTDDNVKAFETWHTFDEKQNPFCEYDGTPWPYCRL